jgi:hypothetical protein
MNKEEKEIQQESKKDDSMSIKDAIIIIAGIIVIFSIFIFIPMLINRQPQRPLTLNEMHLLNYESEPTSESYIYNGFSFLKMPDPRTNIKFWYWQYQEEGKIYDIPMRQGPKEVEYVSWDVIEPLPDRDYQAFFITIDPEERDVNRAYLTLAVSELSEKFSKVKSYPMIAACTENKTLSCKDRPIINCDANTEDNIIILYFKENAEPGITINKNCVTIKGTNETLIDSTNHFIYRMLGVI